MSPKKRAARRTQNIPEHQRHTKAIKIRCAPPLWERVKRVSEEKGRTYAEMLEAGVDATENEKEVP